MVQMLQKGMDALTPEDPNHVCVLAASTRRYIDESASPVGLQRSFGLFFSANNGIQFR
jgi:hypothetical protein